ncbi:polysaccharide biosynthesis protein [Virgibacillus sp. YIM 98842]|uniref:putative polysaccharide biosynthesis protein n=1 Tax=Virgibacillus sp. YIM 98842 TaxID=2663533 RepID=UPI0013DB547A|nr:polysaccharide biosynthesis protein [Virgibacillus sp. YIM 98842]
MPRNESKKLVKGALLLTLAGVISKILSAGYRIPLQNLTGDIGFYIYQQAYPILAIAMTLALYSFPSAISNMAMEIKATGQSLTIKSFYGPVFMVIAGICTPMFIFLLLNAEPLALFVGDENLAGIYQLSAFIFLLVPFTALLRGFFQGNIVMTPTACSQIGEQIIRVSIIIAAAVWVFRTGSDIYHVGRAAAIASIFGALAAILILGLFLLRYHRKSLSRRVTTKADAIPWNYYVTTLLILGLVASLNHMVLIIIQFADTFTLIPGLMDHGLTAREAMEAKGVFDRGQPMIQLGTVLGSSFALALLPSVTKQKWREHPRTFYSNIQAALLFSFYLAAGATIGLILLFPEANTLLFQNDKGTADLQILVLSIFLSSLAMTGAAILQGLEYRKRTAGFILIAFFTKWSANQILVPLWGVTGSAIATVLSLFVLCVLVLAELKRKLPELRFFKRMNWRAFVKAGAVLVLFVLAMDLIFPEQAAASRVYLLFYCVFVSGIGGILYIYLLVRWQAFQEEELRMLPMSSLFLKIYHRRWPNGKN